MTDPGLVPMIRDDEIFLRMNLAERIQHLLLIASFSVLMFTGLPMLFTRAATWHAMAASRGVYGLQGLLHRGAALVLVADLVWHAGYTRFTRRGRENFREMIPRRKDLRDAMALFGYNLGLTGFLYRKGIFKSFFDRRPFWRFDRPPEYGRYNFMEKFEYFAVAWGSLIMIVSGFFMWHVNLSLRLFPLWIHDIFVIVHGYEAMLAFLAVIIWHMYNVHLNPEVFPMSRIWLDGKITGHELRTLHPLEYRKILADKSSYQAEAAGESETTPDLGDPKP